MSNQSTCRPKDSTVDVVLGRLLSAACWNACFSESGRTFLVPFNVTNRQLLILPNVVAHPFDDDSITPNTFGGASHDRWNGIVKRVLRARSVIALASTPLEYETSYLQWSLVVSKVPKLKNIINPSEKVKITTVGLSSSLSDSRLMGDLSEFLADMIACQLSALSEDSIDKAAGGKFYGGVEHYSPYPLKTVNMVMAIPGRQFDSWNFYDGMLFWVGNHLTKQEIFSSSSTLQTWLESSRRWADEKTSRNSKTIQDSIDKARGSGDWLTVPRFAN